MSFTNGKRTFVSAMLLLSLCAVAFGYGFAAREWKLPPYQTLRDARTAFKALLQIASTQEVDGLVAYRRHVTEPTAIRHQPVQPANYVLVSAGAEALKSHWPDGCMAWIVDRDGRVVHFWKNHPELWDDLETVRRVPGISGAISPAGIHLCENGDLLATFHGYNTFPFSVGIARFDRDSRLIWKRELLTHHSFSVAGDGRIFVPALEVVASPLKVGHTNVQIVSESGKVYNDVILELDADGNLLNRIPLLDALHESGYHGHLIRANATTVQSDDPLHLNEALLINRSNARQLPGIQENDLLVSMRNINTIGILDPGTQRFKWMASGVAVGQHSPRIYQRGVLVLDNLGGNRDLGGTQLVHIDFNTRLPRTVFPRADVPLPDLCRTVNSGHLDIDQQEDHALMAVTHEGAIWEVNLGSGEVTWEYIYVHPGGDGTRQKIGSAKYVYDLSFVSPPETTLKTGT